MIDIWSKVTIEPELREHIILSPAMINNFQQEAMRSANPVETLSKLLNDLGREKRDRIEQYNQERMVEDAAKIRDASSWPWGNVLPVKTQPWIVKREGQMRFGKISAFDLTTVRVDGDEGITYPSIEELVKIWSVD